MKRIKIIFETEEDDKIKRFGYLVNKDDLTYITCQFGEDYEPSEVSEDSTITDTTAFGKKIWRLIRFALDEGRKDVGGIRAS